MILLSNNNLRVLSVMKVQMQCCIRKGEDGFHGLLVLGRGYTAEHGWPSSTCPVALALWFLLQLRGVRHRWYDIRVGWLSFCRGQGSIFQLGSVFPMSQAFDFMSSLQSSESGIIVPILQMKLDMQRVCFLLSHRTVVLNLFGTSQGPISWKTIFPQTWGVYVLGAGNGLGMIWARYIYLFWLYF